MLWYTSPANDWSHALPIGNGRLGAMVHGRTTTELLQLNEDSVWYGGPQDRLPRDAYSRLTELREHIRQGRQKEAEDLVRLAFFAYPSSQRHYEPLGNLYLEFGHDDEDKISSYRRELDLESAVSKVEYQYDGVQHRREVFASNPDQVIAIKVESSEPRSFIVRLNRVGSIEYETNEFLDQLIVRDGSIIMHATPGGKGSNRLCCIATARSDDPEGRVEAVGNSLVVHGRKAWILLSAQTTFRTEDPEVAALADASRAFEQKDLFTRHVENYQSLYNRSCLSLQPSADHLPTDERLRAPSPDPGLVALYHNYGRYLLISSNRDGDKALPANLQGIWSPSFSPAWGARWTININAQMNYWPANLCNLSECEKPLFDLLERVAQKGAMTAKSMYGCRGWCAHHNTDIWADTDPTDRWMPSTLWPLGGAWLCTHVWERYLFFGDTSFLDRMFPTLKGCVQFLLDFLIESEDGKYLVTNPSLSPENTFINEHGITGVFCEGSTMDNQILSAVFTAYISAVKILSLSSSSDELTPQVQQALSRLPPPKIGSLGQLQEWGLKDYEELEPGHRHTSQLFGLHPGHSITPSSTPSLAEASSIVLKRRAAHGGGHTGWSRAWLVNLHARLWQAEESKNHVEKLLGKSTLPNLLDDHPPFQIDGNFGGASGIVEMLVQSHETEGEGEGERMVVRIMPAWPVEWGRGSIRGVRARGGFEVDFEWEDGVVKGEVTVKSMLGKKAVILFPGGRRVDIEGEGEHRLKA